jgi:superfamily II DNA or RNA helicase
MKDPIAFNACTDRRGEIHLTRLVHYVASRPEEIEFERSVIDEGVKRDRDIMAITLSVKHASMLHSLYPGSGVLHAGVDPDERLGILKNSKLTFATVSMAKEALNKQKLDSLIILTEFSNRNVLQQAVGRIQRFLKDKKKTKVIVIWHVNIGPMKRMGYKLMSHFRRWGMKVEVK